MDVPNKKSRAEEQMETLAEAVRDGMKGAFPVPENQRESVMDIVRKQLAEERDQSPEQKQARIEQERKKLAEEQAQRQKQEQEMDALDHETSCHQNKLSESIGRCMAVFVSVGVGNFINSTLREYATRPGRCAIDTHGCDKPC